MEFFTCIIEQANTIFSWNFLLVGFFMSLAFFTLDFLPSLHDILHPMFNYFVISSVAFFLLLVCKIVSQLQELVSWKRRKEQEERENLGHILCLSRREAAVLKFLFKQPTYSAWLPPNITNALLLLHKGYIEVISDKRNSFDTLNFYASGNDSLYKLTDATSALILAHKDEVMQKWRKIKIPKDWYKCQ